MQRIIKAKSGKRLYELLPYLIVAIWISIGAYDYYTFAIYDIVSGNGLFYIYVIFLMMPTQLIGLFFGGFIGNLMFNYMIWAGIGFFINFLLWILIVRLYFYTMKK
jgi:hypothetical protein